MQECRIASEMVLSTCAPALGIVDRVKLDGVAVLLFEYWPDNSSYRSSDEQMPGKMLD